ncbi:MAG: hypothetical protein ACXABG_12795, partial [Promethearchaeota archaeon]
MKLSKGIAIDEFYWSLLSTREFFLQNLTRVHDRRQARDFVNQLIMQIVFLSILAKLLSLNGGGNFFVNAFKSNIETRRFPSFLDLYRNFVSVILSKIPIKDEYQPYRNFQNRIPLWNLPKEPSVPDFCFYQSERKKDLRKRKHLPLLNLLEFWDWTQIQNPSYFFGALYERLKKQEEKKSSGSYYTPYSVAEYVCRRVIDLFLVNRLNSDFFTNFQRADEVFTYRPDAKRKQFISHLTKLLRGIKILDPAMGTGHFLECSALILLKYYRRITESILGDEEISNEPLYLLASVILPTNLYGVDNDRLAVNVSKARMFLFWFH